MSTKSFCKEVLAEKSLLQKISAELAKCGSNQSVWCYRGESGSIKVSRIEKARELRNVDAIWFGSRAKSPEGVADYIRKEMEPIR